MSDTNLELFLEGLNAAFGNSFIAALLVIAFGLLLFSIFLLLAVGTVYVIFYAWSGYEDDYDGGNEKQSAFNEDEVWRGMLFALDRLAAALGAILSLALSSVVSVATTILSNPVEFILLVLVFIGTFAWGTYHQLIIRELAEASNCFFGPVYRTLILPFPNIIALALGGWYPIQNFVRHAIVSVTTETIIDSLACAGEQTVVTLRLASLTLVSLSEEISEWIRLGQTGRSVLDIGPDLFNTSQLVGRTLASLDVFAFCACEPLAEVVIRPLFAPLQSAQFAAAINATLTLVPVFVTQGVLRPIIRTVTNVRAMPGAPLNQTIVRPSFNSTFDTADRALNNTGQVGDLFIRAGFEVILNVIGAATQSCDQVAGWRNTRRCTASPDLLPLLNGTCVAGQCITPFVVTDTGCCVIQGLPPLCTRGAMRSSCIDIFGQTAVFMQGAACSSLGAQSCSTFGCCGRTLSVLPNGTAQFDSCLEDAITTECTAPGDLFLQTLSCTAQPVARCATISTGATSRSPSAAPRSCGTCAGTGGFCQCNRCLCGYERADPRFVDAPPVAAGNCTRASEIEEDQDVCIAQLPAIALPPAPGLITGALGLLYETRYIALPRFVFNIVFNVDLVFARVDGIRFWNITDTIGATVNESAENLAAFFFTWPADLIVSVGEAVIAATAPPPAEAMLIRMGTQFVARVIRIVRDAALATVRALVATVAFLIDQFVGIFYGAVEAFITRRGLDPFFHAKRTFASDEPAGVRLICALPTTNTSTPPVFLLSASVTNLTASTCTARFDVLDYCRYVFRQALVETTDAAALAPIPGYLSVSTGSGDIVTTVRSCLATVPGCAPFLVESSASQLAPNGFDVLLERYVDIFRALDRLWLEFGFTAFQDVLTDLAESIKTVLLAIIDFIVHLRELLTTFYAACLDVEGVLDAINRFVRALTNIVRRSSPRITGIVCQAGVGARTGSILCAIPQAVDAFVQIFTELVRIVWLLFVNILRVIEGTRTPESIANVFNTLVLEAHVRDFAFAVFSILTSFIPESVTCSTGIDSTHGCCSALLTINGLEILAGICLERQASVESCREFIDSHLTANSRANIDNINARLFPGALCSAVPNAFCVDAITISQNLTLDTTRGCCADLSRESVLPFAPPPLQALHCVDNQVAFGCVGPRERFFPGTSCVSVPGPAGPLCAIPTPGGPAQPILAEALEQVVVDLLLLIPRIVVGVIQGVVEAIIDRTLDDATFIPLATAFLQPIVVLFIDSFLSLARLFGCIGAFVIQDTLDVLADVLDVVLAVAIEILADLILAVIEFLGGILQVFVEFRFTLLARSALTLLRVFASLVFAIFGPDVGCALQDALCVITFTLNILNNVLLGAVPDVPLTNVDLFVGQCRLRDCCETSPMIEPPVGSVSLCAGEVRFPRPFLFTNCTAAISAGFCNETQGTDHTFRKRSRAFPENTFAVRLDAELRALIDKYNGTAPPSLHHKVPNELFCGSYIATYGYGEAKRQRRRSDGPENQEAELAVECLEVMEQTGYAGSDAASIESARRAWVFGALLEEARPFARIVYMFLQEIGAHFYSVHSKARQATDAYIAGDRKRAAQLLAPTRATGFAAVLKRQHDLDLKQFRRGKPTKAQNLAKRSVFKAESTFVVHHTLVEVAHSAMLSHHSIVDRDEFSLIKKWMANRLSALRVPDINFRKMAAVAAAAAATPLHNQYAGIEMFLKRAGALASRLGDRWAAQIKQQILKHSRRPTTREWALNQVRAVQKATRIARNIKSSRLFPPYRHQFVESRRKLGYTVLQENGQVDEILGNDTLETLSLFVCNASAQICTDCVIVDNLIGAVTSNGRALLEFYPDTTTGFLSYVTRFEESLDTTLINPLGTDTYTTTPKRVPWLFTRFTRVRWFWQWDYSEFLAILASGSTPDPMPERFVNQTGVLQRQFAAAVGRADLENNVYTLLEPAILPALNVLERIVGSVTETIERSVLLRIYERYIECDYTGALLCRGDRGIDSDQPLFDALANILLIYGLVALLFGAILPIGDNVLTTILMLVPVLYITYIIVLWIAYGASFLCTLNALFSGIPGVPSCLPLDIYDFFNELIPQCGVIPIPLIDPAALEEASATLCSICGTTPPLRNCALVAGFLNGLDNIFYTLTSLFGAQAGQVLGDTFGSILPIISETAALYTPEYVAMLGAAGEVCNQITFVNIGTIALILIFIVGTAVLVIAFGTLFAFLVVGFYLVVLYTINLMIRQIDEGFVQGTRVRKLKQE